MWRWRRTRGRRRWGATTRRCITWMTAREPRVLGGSGERGAGEAGGDEEHGAADLGGDADGEQELCGHGDCGGGDGTSARSDSAGVCAEDGRHDDRAAGAAGRSASALQAADKNYVDATVAAAAAAAWRRRYRLLPQATQTVAQPAGTTLAVNNLNGVEYASQYASPAGQQRDCECDGEHGLRERLRGEGGARPMAWVRPGGRVYASDLEQRNCKDACGGPARR